MPISWIALIVAGMFEWGWPIGLKLGWTEDGIRYGPLAVAIISMIISGTLLFYAQRSIPVGTAYAVWTGIGAVGTFILGILFLKEPANIARFVCVSLIVIGIVGLKLVSKD